MGTSNLSTKEQILRDEVRLREERYKKDIRSEAINKFKYICLSILPALIKSIFDPTVRGIHLNISRPDAFSIHSTTEHAEAMGDFFCYKTKAVYFEELFRWN